jgi:hypothetical protein
MAVNVTANFHNNHHTHNNNQHPHPHLDKVDDLEHELEHHGCIHIAPCGGDKVAEEGGGGGSYMRFSVRIHLEWGGRG